MCFIANAVLKTSEFYSTIQKGVCYVYILNAHTMIIINDLTPQSIVHTQ